MPKQRLYKLSITCPLCKIVGYRESTDPFIYLDADGIQDHSSHTSECLNNEPDRPVVYVVEREPDVYRQLPGDPQPPQSGDA